MHHKQWLLLSSKVVIIAGVITATTSMSVQANQSDTSGHQTYSAPSVPVGGSSGSGGSIGKIIGATDISRRNSPGESSGNSRAVTLNDVAKLLGSDLNQSLDQLAASENAAKTADSAPRRIARRATKDCINPAFQARKTVESKLEQSKKFIEQVNQIQPEKAMW
jgi:hypothetical protein